MHGETVKFKRKKTSVKSVHLITVQPTQSHYCSSSYPYTYVTILLKNPTNIYVNTCLFTLLHSYMFQPSRDHPQGVLVRFMSRVNKIHVKMYQIKSSKL